MAQESMLTAAHWAWADELAATVRRRDRPGVVLKMAMTLDGKTAVANGDSRWVSGPAARHLVHVLRSRLGAVMVGAGTVLADDPLLTVRLPELPPARRILVRGQRPWPAHLAAYGDPSPLIVVGPRPGTWTPSEPLHQTWTLADAAGQVDLPVLLARLAAEGCEALLLEGGSRLNGAMLAAGLVDHVVVFVAPKLAGDGPTPISGWSLARMADAWPIEGLTTQTIGDDILLSGRLSPR